jgi:hypothetical protein
MRTILKKQNSTFSLFAAFLLFLSAEKFASCNFSFYSDPFSLQNASITLIEHVPYYQVFDFFTVFSEGIGSFSDHDYDNSGSHFNAFTILKYRYDTITRQILQNLTHSDRNSYTQFRLEIKRSNIPSFPA